MKEAGISQIRDRIPTAGFFDSLRESPGESVLTLSGGPFQCRLEGLPAAQAAGLQSRWRTLTGAAGEAADGPVATIRLRALLAGTDGFLAPPPESERPEEYRIEYACEDGVYLCWSYHFAFRFDPASDFGELALCRTDSPYLEETVENTLRVVFAWKAVVAGGFVMHSAGVGHNGENYLFFGPSGAGKTTISGLCPVSDVLHDDLCIVYPDRNGRPGGTGYMAIGFPFLGDDRRHLARTQVVRPVAGMYRLVQSDQVTVEPMGGARAVAEIMGSLPFVTDQADTSAVALANVTRAIETVPALRLSFRREPTFWDAIDRERRDRTGHPVGDNRVKKE